MALEAQGLYVAHPGAQATAAPAAGPLDFTLAPGEWLGVVGGNGSGKTALLLTLAGLVPKAGGGLRLDGEDPARGGVAARRNVGVVFQEPETQFVSDRVVKELAFPLENLDWPRADVDARVEELLDAFGLRALAAAAPEQLSGGEMQRVALAAAAAPRPRYLLLDEPASYLDAPSRAELERWTRAYVAKEGAAVVWTECERRYVAAADRVLELAGGSGGRVDELVAPAAPFPGRDPGRGPVVAGGPVRWRGQGLRLALPGDGSRAPRTLWGGLDIEVRAGEVWAVTGPNGRGKTALLETLAGWREPTTGRLERPRPDELALVAQFPEYQLFATTAAEDVGFAARHRRTAIGGTPDPREVKERVARALAWVGLDPSRDADRPPESLSLGERRRLALAGILIAEPIALLLDEPTAGLDVAATEKVFRALYDAASRGTAIVLATHDEAIAARLSASRLFLPDPTP